MKAVAKIAAAWVMVPVAIWACWVPQPVHKGWTAGRVVTYRFVLLNQPDGFDEACFAAGLSRWSEVNGVRLEPAGSESANITITNAYSPDPTLYAQTVITGVDSSGHVDRTRIEIHPLWESLGVNCDRMMKVASHETAHTFGLGHVPGFVPHSESAMQEYASPEEIDQWPFLITECDRDAARNALTFIGPPYYGDGTAAGPGDDCSGDGSGYTDPFGCCVPKWNLTGNGVSNVKPVGHINGPLNGSTLTTTASGQIELHFVDADGSVNRVDWFINDQYSSTTFSYPFAVPYVNPVAGTYKVQAALYDTANEYAWSGPVWINVSPTALAADTLQPGERLYPNQQRRSANGQYVLIYQTDGNLVLYGPQGAIAWTGSWGVGHAEMERGGNLVLRNSLGAVVWQTFTGGNVGAGLRVRDNGTVAILSPNHRGNTQLWGAP